MRQLVPLVLTAYVAQLAYPFLFYAIQLLIEVYLPYELRTWLDLYLILVEQ